MTSQIPQEKYDEWLSRIALEFGQHNAPIGKRPDLEDFAALLDDQLTATRREEIVSHLANDSELYSQWQYLVSNQTHWKNAPLPAGTTQDNATDDPIQSLSGQIARLVGRAGQWLQNPIPMGGIAMASVAIVSLMILKPGTQPYPLDDAYDEFSPALSNYLDQQPKMRGQPNPNLKPTTGNQGVVDVLAGIYSGQQHLGFSTSVAGISEIQLHQASEIYKKRDSEENTEKYHLGRWLLLATAVCDQDRENLARLDTTLAKQVFVLSDDATVACNQINTYLESTISQQP